MYPTTDTAKRAHLYLPAAGWGEKDGTFINAERRIGLVKKVRRAPGEALSDFNILRLLAQSWNPETGAMFRDWTSPAAVFQILKKLSAGLPFDFTGIKDYDMLSRECGIQWPWPAGKAAPDTAPPRERRLFEDSIFYHADGRARFLFEAPRPLPEPTDDQFPFCLLTGRGTSAQWHTNTRTGKSAVLRKLHPAACIVEIHPMDAGILKIRNQDRVTISSRRGKVEATAVLTPCVQPGQCFMPMHYEEVNQLTLASFDPHSRQPSYKACAVRVQPAKKLN